MPDIESPESPAVLRTRAEDEVVQFCSELIRFESVNTGDPDTIGDGEAQAARYIKHKLREVGYETTYIESAPGRGNVICRLEGADRTRGSLLIHGHVDVVPADASEWTVDPFSGAVQDGYVWGRGAVDMKDMVAMTLAVAREFKSNGYVPPRDIIFAFVSDEEALEIPTLRIGEEVDRDQRVRLAKPFPRSVASPSHWTTPDGPTWSRRPRRAWPGLISRPPGGPVTAR